MSFTPILASGFTATRGDQLVDQADVGRHVPADQLLGAPNVGGLANDTDLVLVEPQRQLIAPAPDFGRLARAI